MSERGKSMALPARPIAVILSGASHDGALRMRTVKDLGGLAIAQKLFELGRGTDGGSHEQIAPVAEGNT